MKFRFRLVALVLCLFIPLILVLVLLLGDFRILKSGKGGEHKNTINLFQNLKALYKERKFEEVRAQMASSVETLLPLEEGCELVLSVYAQLEDYKLLDYYGKRCFGQKDRSLIVYDAIASSALRLGKEREAFQLLEKELESSGSSDHLLISLAQLSFEAKEYEKSKKYFLRLIKESTIWSAWLQRVFKFKPLFKDPKFIDELVAELSAKKFVSKLLEEKLLSYARLYKLETSIKTLEKRQRGAPSSP